MKKFHVMLCEKHVTIEAETETLAAFSMSRKMPKYRHREYGTGFSAKSPETEEEMQQLLQSARFPSARIELDQKTYDRFRPMIEEHERKRREAINNSEWLSRNLYSNAGEGKIQSNDTAKSC